MTAAVTQALALGAQHRGLRQHREHGGEPRCVRRARGHSGAILLPRGQITASKLAQSMDYGAVVCEIDGNFDDCMRLIQELGSDPSIYVANSINPFRIEGQKTVAFRIDDTTRLAGAGPVVVPGGNMGNSSALGKGFEEMLALGLIDRLPKLSVIQAEGSAPLARALCVASTRKTLRPRRGLPEAALLAVETSANAGDSDQDRRAGFVEERACARCCGQADRLSP